MTEEPRGIVLVVEDDTNIRELICEALKDEGLHVVEAGDGEEAVRVAQQRRPSAVVLDVGLPLLDGAAVADQIREAHGDSLPFIVVTAGGRDREISRIAPVAHLTKPFNVADLIRAVAGAIAPPAGASEMAPGRIPAEG